MQARAPAFILRHRVYISEARLKDKPRPAHEPDRAAPVPALAPPPPSAPGAAPGKTLSPAAQRALQEAAERRAQAAAAQARPPEEGGPAGPEPTRFGDWERKGLAVDF